jgi:hypothetical protein
MSARASRLPALGWGLVLFLLPVFAAHATAATQRLSACGGDCVYQFVRLSMPTDQYSERLVPLFDATATFDDLIADLDAHRIFYTLEHECLSLSVFTKEIQAKLETFRPGDNLIADFRGTTTILKIRSRHKSLGACAAELPQEAARTVETKPGAQPPTITNRKPTPPR